MASLAAQCGNWTYIDVIAAGAGKVAPGVEWVCIEEGISCDLRLTSKLLRPCLYVTYSVDKRPNMEAL